MMLAHFELLPEITTSEAQVASPLVDGVGSYPRGAGTLPISLRVPSRDIMVTVANPNTTDIAVLDTALLSGVVRYPTSAALGEEGNVIIFGHSSGLPVVHNSAFKAFNGLEKVKRGDEIFVSSDTKEYRYVVLSVAKETATSDTAIPLTVEGHILTLATCDSFGKQTDRIVVTAVLVE